MYLEGQEFMGSAVYNMLKSKGEGVKLQPLCKIPNPKVVTIGNHTRIRDFTFIWPGEGVTIGEHCDIQPDVTVWGGGKLWIGNGVCIGPGTQILTGKYDLRSKLSMVDGMPCSLPIFEQTTIKDHVYIGAGCKILSGVTIGEGAIIGAGAVVNKDVDEWTVVAGIPAKKISDRPRLLCYGECTHKECDLYVETKI